MQIIPILMYHSISNEAAPRFRKFILPPAMFDQHVAYMRDQGYTPLTVAQLASLINSAPGSIPSKPVILTFDDGFTDFYTAALPILQKYNFPASLYIVTGYMEKTSLWMQAEGEAQRQMMSWSQLSEVALAGIECGAHTHTHPHLDTLTSQAALTEMIQSKETLEQHLACPVNTFAYPYGHFDKTVRALAEQAGFQAAVAVRNAMSHPGDDRFSLARMLVPNGTDVARLGALLSGKGIPLAKPQESPLVFCWRQFRRFRANYG